MINLSKKNINDAINEHPKQCFDRLILGDMRGNLSIWCDTVLPKSAWRNMFAEDATLSLHMQNTLSLKASSIFAGNNTFSSVKGETEKPYQLDMKNSSLSFVVIRNEPITEKNNHLGELRLRSSNVSVGTLQMADNEQIDLSHCQLAKVNVCDSTISFTDIEADEPGSLISNCTLAGTIIKVDKVTLSDDTLSGLHYEGRVLNNKPLYISGGKEQDFVGQLIGTEYMVYDGNREVNLGVWEQHYVKNCTNFVLAGIYNVYLHAFKQHRDVCRLLARN